MKIKNLKINDRTKALIGACILAGTMFATTGCSKNNNSQTETVEGITYEQVISDNKIIKVSDLMLRNRVTGDYYEEVDSVLVGNKLMNVDNPVVAKLNKDISYIIVKNEMISIDDCEIVNRHTNEVITNLDYIIEGDSLVEFEGNDLLVDSSKSVIAQYNEAVDKFFNDYNNRGYEEYLGDNSQITIDEAKAFVALYNIDVLKSLNNPEALEILSIFDEYNDPSEVINDACSIVGSLIMHNSTVINVSNDVEDMIMLSNYAIGNKSQEDTKYMEDSIIELAKLRIAANENGVNIDAEKANEIVAKLFLDLNTGNLANVEKGTGLLNSLLYLGQISNNLPGYIPDYPEFSSLNEENAEMFNQLSTNEQYLSDVRNMISSECITLSR